MSLPCLTVATSSRTCQAARFLCSSGIFLKSENCQYTPNPSIKEGDGREAKLRATQRTNTPIFRLLHAKLQRMERRLKRCSIRQRRHVEGLLRRSTSGSVNLRVSSSFGQRNDRFRRPIIDSATASTRGQGGKTNDDENERCGCWEGCLAVVRLANQVVVVCRRRPDW